MAELKPTIQDFLMQNWIDSVFHIFVSTKISHILSKFCKNVYANFVNKQISTSLCKYDC